MTGPEPVAYSSPGSGKCGSKLTVYMVLARNIGALSNKGQHASLGATGQSGQKGNSLLIDIVAKSIISIAASRHDILES